MNESYHAADSYLHELQDASHKLEYFESKFIPKLGEMDKQVYEKNEELPLLYLLNGQNKMRRGYYVEAEICLKKAQKMLRGIYGQ
jgi:hypothetical protein